jgi:hypothetical protein
MSERIVIAGAIAQKPGQGGHAWALLQWALGLQRLGFEVLWIDRLDAGHCHDAAGGPVQAEQSVQVEWFDGLMREFGVADRSALLVDGERRSLGIDRPTLIAALRDSAFLLNIMGFLDDEELLAAAPRRVFLDIDPGFGQMWRELGLADLFAGHDDFVTVGRNVGRDGCRIPGCGLDWIATRPPVVLERWPAHAAAGPSSAFRSVATWRGRYAPIEMDGEMFGLRVHEFRRFAPLPRLTGERFELALDIDPADHADRDRLLDEGWRLVDPRAVAGDPWSYRRFVAGSAGEISVAKQIYVRAASGWFSDRSACFLASGRPVVAQDTGFDGEVPTGEGLLTFRTLDEAAAAVGRVAADLPRHSRAARRLAERWFDSDRVLTELLAELEVAHA